MAVYRRDRRLPDRLEPVDRLRVEMTPASLVGVPGVGQVVPGSEAPAGAGEDDAPDGVVSRDGLKVIAQFDHHGPGDRVQLLRAFKRQRRDAAGVFAEDDSHILLPGCSVD